MDKRYDCPGRRWTGDSLSPTTSVFGTPVSRREAICRGLAGAAGLLLAGVSVAGASAAVPPKGKAKSVIQIWASGGPTHLDTFDP